MELPLVAVRAALAGLFFLLPTAAATAATPSTPPENNPASLVDAALRSELDGPSAARATLLKQALALDPDFAPARWQLGYVRWNDEWLALDEVAGRVTGDKTLGEYRQRRDALIDTADAHRELAVWCRRNKLVDEERVHWAKVLEFDPQDAEALAALKLELYEGRLLTKDQVAQAKKQAGQQLHALKHWQPQMIKWRKAIESGSAKERAAALESLEKLVDPEVIGALELIFAEDRASQKSDELNLLLIRAVGRMQVPEATSVLLRRAILPDSVSVRAAAADELKKRPMFAYVPQLIAALPGKIKTKFHIYVTPGGMVLHEHEVYLEGSQADVSLSYESLVNPADMAAALLMTPRGLSRELASARMIEARAEATRTQLNGLRDRFQFVLKCTTGFDQADDPALWEKQYDNYYGWYPRPESKPTYQYSVQNSNSYFTAPVNIGVRSHSCFPSGTPIQTMDGPKPVEQIKVGDRVLSQNTVTGELTFVPVQTTTLRQPTPLLQIRLETGSITATPGHPFWVVGRGWRTAKQLVPGSALHGLHGASYVRAIAELPPAEVYNLVLSGVHNYFVGESNLLVHDNSPLEQTSVPLPGLVAQGVSP